MRLLTMPVCCLLLLLAVAGCSVQGLSPAQERSGPEIPDGFVLVEGGTFANRHSRYYGQEGKLASFYIGKYEITQKEWTDVMGSNPSAFNADHLPVDTVSWYDALEYCNKRSIKEGLKPFYRIDTRHADPENRNEHDSVKWTVTYDAEADGYRLPTEAEWEYAAGGGRLSESRLYSGSDDADEVAWYWRNAGNDYLSGGWNWPAIEQNENRTRPVGSKQPNELGLYDMSGNVREWCWDWYAGFEEPEGMWRVTKGGGWVGDVSNTEPAFRGKFDPNGLGPDQGFRVVRGL